MQYTADDMPLDYYQNQMYLMSEYIKLQMLRIVHDLEDDPANTTDQINRTKREFETLLNSLLGTDSDKEQEKVFNR